MGITGSRGKRDEEAAKFGQLYLHTDHPAYKPGDTVTGKIYVNIENPYPGNELFLRLKGKEAVYMAVEHQDAKGRSTEERHTRINKVIDHVIPIHQLSVLSKYQCILPFSFMIPAKLPCTFRQEGYRYVADIRYEIGVFLKPLNIKDPKLKYKQELVIWDRPKIQPEETIQETNTALKSCCCLPQGTCNLKMILDNPNYRPGEKAKVVVELNNTGSKLNNTQIIATFKQKLTLKYSKNHSRFFPPECKKLNRVTTQITGVAAGSEADKQQVIEVTLPQIRMIKEKLPSKGPKVPYLLSLKEDYSIMNPSTSGSLITSEYVLTVICAMEGTCTNAPTISIPVEVNFPDIHNAPLPEAPANWKPKTLDHINIAIGVDSNSSPDGSYNVALDMASSQVLGEHAQFLNPKAKNRSIIPIDAEKLNSVNSLRTFTPQTHEWSGKQL